MLRKLDFEFVGAFELMLKETGAILRDRTGEVIPLGTGHSFRILMKLGRDWDYHFYVQDGKEVAAEYQHRATGISIYYNL